MKIEDTKLDGVKILTPRRFSDHRGFFSECWNRQVMAEAGLGIDFVQDNHSLSFATGTLRGLHFQKPPHAQTKLVRCGRGRLYDVAVDIRHGSPTYGQWVGTELSYDNGKQMLIPRGFLHGFVTREPGTEIIYKCDAYYHAASESAVRWDDPAIGIDWGVNRAELVLSEKDAAAAPLSELAVVFHYEGVS